MVSLSQDQFLFFKKILLGIKREYSIVLASLVFIGLFLQWNYLDDFPNFIHAWAQADRLAITHGFLNNGFNFFEPETFLYNKQFPHNWTYPHSSTITSVDFPVHDYVVALLMKNVGSTAPMIYRLYTFCWSILGLFYFFKFCKLLTSNFYRSLLTVIIVSTSPVFVYYQAGFLPTIPALSCVFIGLYHYTKSFNKKQCNNKSFYIAIVFLSLASLTRTTFVIIIIAVFGNELLRTLKTRRISFGTVVSFLLTTGIFFTHKIHNANLREEHGSLFLNHLLPAASMQNYFEIICQTFQNWWLSYFSIPHYILAVMVVVVLIYQLLIRKVQSNNISGYMYTLIALLFLGYFAFSIAMTQQFIHHDYYFLDTLFLPTALSVPIAITFIPKSIFLSKKFFTIFALAVVTIFLVNAAKQTQIKRRVVNRWNKSEQTTKNFTGTDLILKDLKIAKNAKILILESQAPNIPLMLMNRKGYVVANFSSENIHNALQMDYDYIVTQNQYFFKTIYSLYPKFISETSKIYDNGVISISVKDSNSTSLVDYLNIDEKKIMLDQTMHFDNVKHKKGWRNVNTSNKKSVSGDKSCLLRRTQKYGLTYSNNDCRNFKGKNLNLLIQSDYNVSDSCSVEIVLAVNNHTQPTRYQNVDLSTSITQPGIWKSHQALFKLPQIQSDSTDITLFLLNKDSAELYLDDFRMVLYEN